MSSATLSRNAEINGMSFLTRSQLIAVITEGKGFTHRCEAYGTPLTAAVVSKLARNSRAVHSILERVTRY